MPKFPAGNGIDEPSEKGTRRLNDPHAAKTGTSGTTRGSVATSVPRSLLIGLSKCVVETTSSAVRNTGTKSGIINGPILWSEGCTGTRNWYTCDQ